MKDALGHGSDNRGGSGAQDAAAKRRAFVSRFGVTGGTMASRSAGVGVHGRYLIQKLNTKLVGNPWQVAKRVGNATVAERTAERMRIDNPDTLFRVK